MSLRVAVTSSSSVHLQLESLGGNASSEHACLAGAALAIEHQHTFGGEWFHVGRVPNASRLPPEFAVQCVDACRLRGCAGASCCTEPTA